MLNFNSKSFINVVIYLNGLKQTLATFQQIKPNDLHGFTRDHIKTIQSDLGKIRDECSSMHLPLTIMEIERLVYIFSELSKKEGKPVPEKGVMLDMILLDKKETVSIRQIAGEILSRFHDELSTRLLLPIDNKLVNYYEQKDPIFGDEVAKKFPSLLYDLEQGGKCHALGFSTAAVFHFIRCLEGGIYALSRCLNIPDPIKGAQRNWGAMLTNIKNTLEAKWPGAQNKFGGDGQYFDEAYAALSGMQNPYRNVTMHLAKTYTEDQARLTIPLIENFMKKLAERMDENGEPKMP